MELISALCRPSRALTEPGGVRCGITHIFRPALSASDGWPQHTPKPQHLSGQGPTTSHPFIPASVAVAATAPPLTLAFHVNVEEAAPAHSIPAAYIHGGLEDTAMPPGLVSAAAAATAYCGVTVIAFTGQDRAFTGFIKQPLDGS